MNSSHLSPKTRPQIGRPAGLANQRPGFCGKSHIKGEYNSNYPIPVARPIRDHPHITSPP